MAPRAEASEVRIQLGPVVLPGALTVPEAPEALVIFVHGSGSSRLSSRNQAVARALQQRRLGTLLFDLLTPDEDRNPENRFDIPLLTQRLLHVTQWSLERLDAALSAAYFGASTGAAAALRAAAERPDEIGAVVSRGGRPDLAEDRLAQVRAPTLLIVGGADEAVIHLNRKARQHMTAECRITIIPGATHLFEEPGALDEVSRLAGDWIVRHCHRPVAS